MKNVLNTIMGIMLIGSATLSCLTTGTESSGWMVATLSCTIFLIEKFRPEQ